MSAPLVLSLFPGIGLLDRGFEDEGFCVVRGPDLLWGGDIKRFAPPRLRFDGIIGGPPCQAFSSMSAIVRARGHTVAANLIPEYERCVLEAAPSWFLMENVPRAPLPVVAGYDIRTIVLDNRQAPDPPEGHVGAEQQRVRRFSFGSVEGLALHPRVALFANPTWAPTVMAGHGRPIQVLVGGHETPRRTPDGRLVPRKIQRKPQSWEEARRLQGLPEDFDLPPFKDLEKKRAVGNGVPYPLARMIARAVREALARVTA